MTVILRILCGVVALAFLFAVANLFIAETSDTAAARPVQGIAADAAFQTAELTAELTGEQGPSTPQIMRDMAFALLGIETTSSATAMSAAPLASAPSTNAPLTATPLAAVQASDVSLVLSTTPDTTDRTITRVAAAWSGWLVEQGVEGAAMALILPDGTEYGTGIGRTADDRRPVMSLSKAITGLCLDTILVEQGLPWSTTLGDIAPQMSSAGVTPRAWNEQITLAQLVTHTAGLEPDLTQFEFFARTHGALGLHRRFAAEALTEEAITGTPGRFFYSNTNFAVLGVVVEALTGESYAQACMDRVITPAALDDVVIEGRFGSLSSYAGWELSAINYARLARHWFPADAPHIADPESRPNMRGYAIGYRITGSGTQAQITHNGRMCHRSYPDGGVGSTVIALGDGTVFTANWDGCLEEAQSDALTQAIADLL